MCVAVSMYNDVHVYTHYLLCGLIVVVTNGRVPTLYNYCDYLYRCMIMLLLMFRHPWLIPWFIVCAFLVVLIVYLNSCLSACLYTSTCQSLCLFLSFSFSPPSPFLSLPSPLPPFRDNENYSEMFKGLRERERFIPL